MKTAAAKFYYSTQENKTNEYEFLRGWGQIELVHLLASNITELFLKLKLAFNDKLKLT